jgi:uncharacterized small protein (DUF1192 family)
LGLAYGKFDRTVFERNRNTQTFHRTNALHAPGNETMSLFDEDVPKKSKPGTITVGEDISSLSESDLAERIGALGDEINRTQKELEQRGTIRDAANSIFSK